MYQNDKRTINNDPNASKIALELSEHPNKIILYQVIELDYTH